MAGRDGIRVPLDDLLDLSRDLSTVRSTMERTSETVDSTTEILGSGTIQDALHDFEHRWKDKREEIDKNAEALVNMIDSTHEQFTEADANLADSLTQNEDQKTITGAQGQRVSF
ncbi:MAG: hypothetical protein QM635_02205 [Microbacteriaceae bacterium]